MVDLFLFANYNAIDLCKVNSSKAIEWYKSDITGFDINGSHWVLELEMENLHIWINGIDSQTGFFINR